MFFAVLAFILTGAAVILTFKLRDASNPNYGWLCFVLCSFVISGAILFTTILKTLFEANENETKIELSIPPAPECEGLKAGQVYARNDISQQMIAFGYYSIYEIQGKFVKYIFNDDGKNHWHTVYSYDTCSEAKLKLSEKTSWIKIKN